MNIDSCRSRNHHQWSSVRTGIKADIRRYLTRSEEDSSRGEGLIRRLSAWLTPELMCLSLYRLSHFFHARGWISLSHFIAGLNFLIHKARIPAASCIGPGCRLSHPSGIVFEGIAGSDLTIYSYVICMIGERKDGQSHNIPRIGNQVILGGQSVLNGNLKIGNGVRISPGAVVQTDIPDNAIVASYRMYTAVRKDTSYTHLNIINCNNE